MLPGGVSQNTRHIPSGEPQRQLPPPSPFLNHAASFSEERKWTLIPSQAVIRLPALTSSTKGQTHPSSRTQGVRVGVQVRPPSPQRDPHTPFPHRALKRRVAAWRGCDLSGLGSTTGVNTGPRGVLSSIPRPRPLHLRSTPRTVTTTDVPRHCQYPVGQDCPQMRLFNKTLLQNMAVPWVGLEGCCTWKQQTLTHAEGHTDATPAHPSSPHPGTGPTRHRGRGGPCTPVRRRHPLVTLHPRHKVPQAINTSTMKQKSKPQLSVRMPGRPRRPRRSLKCQRSPPR